MYIMLYLLAVHLYAYSDIWNYEFIIQKLLSHVVTLPMTGVKAALCFSLSAVIVPVEFTN